MNRGQKIKHRKNMRALNQAKRYDIRMMGIVKIVTDFRLIRCL